MTEIIIFIGIVIPELVLRTNQKYTLVVKRLLGTKKVLQTGTGACCDCFAPDRSYKGVCGG